MTGRGRNISVSEASRPVLPRHARLKFDETRQVWVILAPERVLAPDEIAVEAYVHFVRDRSPLEAIASSLTELFAPNLHEERISGMLAHYDFVNPDIMSYFSRRLTQAPRDAGFALDYVKVHARTPGEREAVCNALLFKTNVLWVQLDALYHAYVNGHIPPGAFVPQES